MTLTQTIDIPLDRRVHLDFVVPSEVPTGRTNLVIQFPVSAKTVKRKLTAEEEKLSIANNIEFINEFMEGVLEDQSLDLGDSTK